jgi:streptomycin 6-kinase
LTPDLYLERRQLAADGAPIETPSSLLLAVRRNGGMATVRPACWPTMTTPC